MKKNSLICLIIVGLAILFSCLCLTKLKVDNRKKITFWTIQLKPIYERQLEKIISNFENKHKDYKVVWIDIPIQEAQKRTLASVLSSTPPDLINLNPEFSVILAQRGVLEYFDEEKGSQFNKNILDKLKYNDKIYALPFYVTSPVTIYNKAVYDKCIGKKFITSYDELFKISDKLSACAKIPAFVLSINENDTLAKILNKYDVSTLSNLKEQQETVKLFFWLNKMYKNNSMPKDILSITHRESIEKYMSNQAIITVSGANFINMIKQNAIDTYKNSAIAPQLTGKNGKYEIALMNLIIPKKAQNKELALELALELTNKENQLELSKLTNVLPVNKYALEDNRFKNCEEDLYEKARCISVKQLNNLNTKDFGQDNKKTINETINKTLEEILLDKNSNQKTIEKKIEILSEKIQELQKR